MYIVVVSLYVPHRHIYMYPCVQIMHTDPLTRYLVEEAICTIYTVVTVIVFCFVVVVVFTATVICFVVSDAVVIVKSQF